MKRFSMRLFPFLFILIGLLWLVQQRPFAHLALDREAAAWIRQNSDAGVRVLADWQIGLLARREVTAVSIETAAPSAMAALLDELDDDPPDIIVSTQALGWQYLIPTGWFQEHYEKQHTLSSTTGATRTIWQYRPGPFDDGTQQPVEIRSDEGVRVVGYQIAPARIQPGEAVHVTLYMQATQPHITPFNTIVRVISPLDGVAYAQKDELRPTSRPVGWWQPGQIIAERFVLTTTLDIPVGAYQIDVGFRPSRSEAHWTLYQGQDGTPLERVGLGLTAVSWRGSFADATPINAQFDDQIRLLAAQVDGELTPGSTLDVSLYWQALRQPDADYVVFVHLLDGEGNFVQGADGKPVNGRFPTHTWLPDDILKDTHLLTLPADLPVGDYQIKTGLYLLETGVRLPAQDANNNLQLDQAIQIFIFRTPSAIGGVKN